MAHVGCPARTLFALCASMGVCHHSRQGLMALAPSPRVRVRLPLACARASPRAHVPLPLARVLPSPLRTCAPALTRPTSPCSHFACGQGRVGCTGPGWCAWAWGGVRGPGGCVRARRGCAWALAVHARAQGDARGWCRAQGW